MNIDLTQNGYRIPNKSEWNYDDDESTHYYFYRGGSWDGSPGYCSIPTRLRTTLNSYNERDSFRVLKPVQE